MAPAVLLAVALAVALAAAAPGDAPAAVDDGAAPRTERAWIEAAPRVGPVHVDGRLDELAWERARPYDAFVQLYPSEGARPSERTEVRVLFDAEQIYVGIVCHDSRPTEVQRNLGYRDAIPPGDVVTFAVDPSLDRRSGVLFAVSAAGVLEDRILYDDIADSTEWDAVWEGASAARHDGWSAELAIPLTAFQFRPGEGQRWGVYVQRKLGREHEVIASTLIPLGSGRFVSSFGELRLGDLAPHTARELVPYFAARTTLRPQYSDPSRPTPRLADPSADAGLDLRMPVGRRLALAATMNPDFGQVEADAMILNLTRFEAFFPEKRPFFLQGMDLFEPVGGGVGTAQQLLYTRRVGLTAPILAAAKLTGELSPGLQFGVFDAFVSAQDERVVADESRPDRSVAYRIKQPLHLGLADAFPVQATTAENYLGLVLRRHVGAASTVGLRVALATPADLSCSEGDAAARAPPPGCRAFGGNAGAVDWLLRSGDARWSLSGQLAASQVVGGPPRRTLGDGTVIRPGDAGVGAYVTAGKTGGEPWRAYVGYSLQSPRLELNAAGYQPNQNEHLVRPELRFARPSGLGSLRAFSAGAALTSRWSADGHGLGRGVALVTDVTATLPSFHDVGCDASVEDPQHDLREIFARGVPYRRPVVVGARCGVATDPNRRLSLELGGGMGRTFATGTLPATTGWNLRGATLLRAVPRAETRLTVTVGADTVPGRFFGVVGDRLVFGDLGARSLSITLGQGLLLRPRLAFDAHAQLFVSGGSAGQVYVAPARLARVDPRDLSPAALRDDSAFGTVSLVANAVLRWDYRRGSTLYAVYARTQRNDAPRPSGALSPSGLARGAASDSFLLKWTYYYSL